jgi:hypothetical protein
VRRVIVHDDMRETQIRPDSGFTTYIEMLQRDFERFRSEATFVDLPSCPACGHTESEPDFVKMKVQYVSCLRCRTCYATPRPTLEDLDRFYAESEAIKYWHSTLAENTAMARRQFIFGPRATWVLETASLHHKDEGVLVDFYTKYPAFLDEVAIRGRFSDILVRKPMVELGTALETKIVTEAKSLEEDHISVVSAFEVVERLFDPFTFLEHIHQILLPGGLVFLTTLSISGFDLNLLRQRARNLLPPTHLTLLSYEGAQILMERSGFDLVELSTPGQLDVALVLDAIKREPDIQLPQLFESVLLRRGPQVQEAFQDFLQQANLSSHVWIAAKKQTS